MQPFTFFVFLVDRLNWFLVFLVDLGLKTFFEYRFDDFLSPEIDKMSGLFAFLQSLIQMVIKDEKVKILWQGFKKHRLGKCYIRCKNGTINMGNKQINASYSFKWNL